MREIKFRAKRLVNGKWAYGCYVQYSETDGYIHGDCVEDGFVWDVDTTTVGQYTGLKDKNGREIYEGDIVSCVSRMDAANMVVIFETGEFQMVLCEKFKNYIPLCGFYCIRNFTKEVIGNIYDNPEMIGG